MKTFFIDFFKLAVMLLPTMLRKPAIVSFLTTMMNELQHVYEETIPAGYRMQNLYRLNHNVQVCYLRKVLNDAFLRTRENGFEIVDASQRGNWLVAYNENEYRADLIPILKDDEFTVIYDEDINNNQEVYNFVVLYPSDLTDNDIIRMKTIVNNYKLVSRTPIYKIKQYE